MLHKFSRERMAQLVAADIDADTYVNLGIGMPTLVADYLDPARGVVLHSENGILGMRGLTPSEVPDPDLMNATKEPVMLTPGASITDHVVSFCMMRGGHLDLTVLGAFQVSKHGDLANWDTGHPDSIPAVGGAMDLVAGARKIFVMMQHQDKSGASKIVPECTYPLTGKGVVNRIYTDLAIIDIEPTGLIVRAMVDGLTFEQLQHCTDVPIRRAGACMTLTA
jgi:3-oxoadipate CoA-transferase, beta subunit